MPPKQCAKCSKTVYPTEELKCLDKVWHKGCFRCEGCNMTLNMKNYKGYNKLPYCNAHYPKTKFTAVADTPENRRIAENTKIQSNIKYHEEFEKQKGKLIAVADDPEVQRVKQNMNVISNISYHGERDRKQEMERIRPAEQVEGQRNQQPYQRPTSGSYGSGAGRHRQNPGRIADYDPDERMAGGGNSGTPYSNRNSASARQVYDSSVGKEDEILTASTTSPGRVDAGRRISQGSVRNRVQRFSSSGDEEQGFMEQPQTRKVGSIHDYDPLNENYGSIAGQNIQDSRRAQQPQQQPYQPPPQQSYQPPPQQYQPPPPAEPQAPRNRYSDKGIVCTAMYDYDAADTDEVSFREGDFVIHCQPIDEGWMEGTVEKTGQRGMLPSNYVERVN